MVGMAFDTDQKPGSRNGTAHQRAKRLSPPMADLEAREAANNDVKALARHGKRQQLKVSHSAYKRVQLLRVFLS